MGKRLSYTHCVAKFASRSSYLCITSSGLAGLLWSFHKHTVTVLISQLFSCLTITYPHRTRASFRISLQHADQKNADENSPPATTSHTLRTYLCIKPKQTSARREHGKHFTGLTIRTAKSRFLDMCAQSSQVADNTGMQATRRRSCCALQLSVPISSFQMIDNVYTNSRQAARRG